MMYALAQATAWLSCCREFPGTASCWPPWLCLPGWLSATAVAAVTGVLLLVVFKYTSNQAAIKRVRNDINANLLTLEAFQG